MKPFKATDTSKLLGENEAIPLQSGLTLVDVMVFIVILGILGGLLIPAMRKAGGGPSWSCINSLKQIGIGFRLYANDNRSRLPMQISTNEGGSMEFTNKTDEAWRHFWAAGSELANPIVLHYFAIKKENKLPNDFLSLNGDDEHLSYFIGIHAQPENSNHILSGDADIYLNKKLMSKSAAFPSSSNYSWGIRHKGAGNLLFADGSAREITSNDLIRAVNNQSQ